MAKAQYAASAGSADTAADADKLGGYDASEYLRKDEVKNTVAAYQEIEWTSPGTYNWVVPEGVNSILVTTVGGGGNYGFFEYYDKNNKRYLIFPGGSGGEVTVNKLVPTTPGETLQIVVGAAGAAFYPGHGSFNEDDIAKYSGTDGADGGMSYIARNGTMISSTKARGGAGGCGGWGQKHWNCLYNSNTGQLDKCYYWYNSYLAINTSNVTTEYRGGYVYYGDGYSSNAVLGGSALGISGYSGKGGAGTSFASGGGYDSAGYWMSKGYYINCGGGGSWGDGGDETTGQRMRAGVGGGGKHESTYYYVLPGHGMVRILAIGITYDE